MEWGDNEFGQLGNRKRVYSEHPIILSKFSKDNLVDLSCGYNSSAVICEYDEEQDTQKEIKKT